MLPVLDAAECVETTTASGTNTPGAAFLDVPAASAVVVLRGPAPEGRAVLIATTADARDFARRKLLPGPVATADGGSQPSRPRIDMGALVASLQVYPAGSSLEAEAIYLAQARMHMPTTHAAVSERWRAWFIQIDPAAEFPQWTKTNLARAGTVAPRSASTAVAPLARRTTRLIGPLPDKDTAGRVIEQTIDAFDLCRFNTLLQQAPSATACAYKEMGRCPAPCDGTEPMRSYRERTRAAAHALCSGMDASIERLERQMRDAAAAMEFEAAASLQHRINRLRALTRPALTHLAELATWSLLFVLPHSRADLARLLLLTGPRLGVLGDLPRKAEPAAAARLAAAALDHAAQPERLDGSAEQIDAISVASRWLFLPAAKKRGQAIRLHRGMPVEALTVAIQKAARGLVRARPGPTVSEQQVDVLT